MLAGDRSLTSNSLVCYTNRAKPSYHVRAMSMLEALRPTVADLQSQSSICMITTRFRIAYLIIAVAVTQPHHRLSCLSPLTGMYGSFHLGAVFIVDCL
jgi:hypothetical protein